MADDKWIAGLHGTMPVSDAAKIVLPLRLGVVRDLLPAAVQLAEDDVEHVHQLRVGTRRAAAALRIFADYVPKRLHKTTRKALRDLRRSAGEARDWDVFLEELRGRLARVPLRQRRGLDLLVGFAHGQRVRAQNDLRQAFDDQAETFACRIDEVAAALDTAGPSSQTLSDAAAPMLGSLLHDLESASAGDLQDYAALHAVRILGKRLRYAMEIFAGCYTRDFKERYYPAIVEMQDILGDANDSHVAVQRLSAFNARLERTQPKQWPAYRGGIEALIEMHEKRLPGQRRKFERWRRAWQKSGAEQAFAELIRAR
jgi:CHAD domain-containing protein